jgi:HlyD family secretion protein
MKTATTTGDNRIETETLQGPKPLGPPVPPRHRHRVGPRWLAFAALILLLSGAGLWWWRVTAVTPPRYATVTVSRGSIAQSVTATGTVNPVLTITVGSYVSGVIQSLYCDYNTKVKAAQVCAKIDPRPFQATLNQYEGQLWRDQALLDEAKVDLARYQKLASENSIALQQVDLQGSLVHQYEGTVKLDEGLVEGAKLNLEYTNIVSPVSGTVVSRNVTQGQTVAASFQTPTLFLIATDLKKMQVDTNVSESDVGSLKQGDAASFTVDAFPDRVFRGTVVQVRQSPQTVQNVVTYDVVVGMDNSDLALMPGMTASTQIVIQRHDDVLRVPDQALRYSPGNAPHGAALSPNQARVWLLRDRNPVALPIVTGLDDGTFTEVVEGDLKPGDAVITSESSERTGRLPATPLARF